MVQTVNNDNFADKVLNADGLVVIDVWAVWCGPCKMQDPIFKKAAKQYADQATFLKLDADANQDLVRQYRIMGIPTLLYFNHGVLVDRKTGVQTESAIANSVDALATISPEEAAEQQVGGIWSKVLRRLRGK